MTYYDRTSVPQLPEYLAYREREDAARHTYLQCVIEAHHTYLTGPFPDRDAYARVDAAAWNTYYQACRLLWADYYQQVIAATTRTITSRPVTPAPAAPSSTARPPWSMADHRDGYPPNETDDSWLSH